MEDVEKAEGRWKEAGQHEVGQGWKMWKGRWKEAGHKTAECRIEMEDVEKADGRWKMEDGRWKMEGSRTA